MNKSGKVIGRETHNISDEYTIECEMRRTRSGTREWAHLLKDNWEIARASDFWINRPWYRFTYENAIRECLRESGEFSDEQVKQILDAIAERDLERVNAMFGTLKAVCAVGEVLNDNQKDRNDWKARMLKAGLPQLQIPDDWDELSEDEKERRINAVLEVKA